MFNDSTKLVLDEAGNELTYIEKSEKEHYYSLEAHPAELTKKVTLLKYFRSYMNEHLIKAGGDVAIRVSFILIAKIIYPRICIYIYIFFFKGRR